MGGLASLTSLSQSMQATKTLFADISTPNDDQLDTDGFREEAMRFEQEKGQIGCLAHILDLI
jgi:hypothetical protein